LDRFSGCLIIYMRKIIQFLVLLFASNLIFGSLSAQLPKILVFANGTYASPTNTEFKNISNYGVGFEVGGGIGFGKTMLIASVGRMKYNLPQQSVGGVILFEAEDFKVTPLKLGLRRYLIAGLFINGELGVAISSTTNFLYEAGAGWKLGFF